MFTGTDDTQLKNGKDKPDAGRSICPVIYLLTGLVFKLLDNA